MFKNIPWDRVNWVTSIFLIVTFVLTFTAVPAYLYYTGFPPLWLIAMTLFYIMATGFSITFGYHRLFAHRAFDAATPVKLANLIFGAASFENSAMDWVADHRNHHKHVDHDDDPYDISKGFFWAHIGWLLFRVNPKPPRDNIADLRKDPLVLWQDRHVHSIGLLVGFVLPSLIGYFCGGATGALGGFLLAGIFRVTVVQHSTFLINSACHYWGSQPYSKKCSARDSWFMALFTFGEGYHNYHHEFQSDYRNGVKPWNFDPTKWLIWTLSKVGLTRKLRRIDQEKISQAETAVKEGRRGLGDSNPNQAA